MEVFKKILGILFVWLNFYNKDLGEKNTFYAKKRLKIQLSAKYQLIKI